MTKKTYLVMAALVLVLSQVGSTGMPAYADTSARALSEMPIHTTERASLAGLPLANITAVEAAELFTEPKNFWGGETFQTRPEDWVPGPPDIQPYN